MCDARKRVVVPAGLGTRFVLQDMGVHTKETLGEYEDWDPVLEGPLVSASGAFGARTGGVMVGPRGTESDDPFIDLEMRMGWARTEYWNLSLANLLQALAHLMPRDVPTTRKLGRTV